MVASCLPLILLLVGGGTAAPIVGEANGEDEDVEWLTVANAGK